MVVSNKLLIFAASHGLGKSSRMIYNKKRGIWMVPGASLC